MRQPIGNVYQLKIVLSDIRPQIWRRVQIPWDIRLDDLHLVLQAAMGWTNSHLHCFMFGDRRFTMPYEEGALEELQMEDERKLRLNDLISASKDTFLYTYDFGDDWEHVVTLEKVLPPFPNTRYPLCMAGKRACPPEDCGSVPGYVSLLKVLANPRHPEHKDMKQWVGRKYDPELFDPEKFDKDLRRLQSYARIYG